jgi:hypothetical protein
MDATSNLTSGAWGDTTANSLGPVFGLVIALAGVFAIVGAVLIAASSTERLRWVLRVFGVGASSLRYFGIGLVVLAPLAAVGYVMYLVATMEGETQRNLGKWALGGAGVFAFVALVGYASERVFKRLKANAAKIRTEAQEA